MCLPPAGDNNVKAKEHISNELLPHNHGSSNHHDYATEIWTQLKVIFPTAASFCMYRMPWLTSLWFVGRLIGRPQELAAAAFANSLCNILGMAFSVGMNSALTTLTSQAVGRSSRSCSTRNKQQQEDDNDEKDIEMTQLLSSSESSCDGTDPTRKRSFNHDNGSNQNNNSNELMLPLVYLYRGWFVILCITVPIAMWWTIGIAPLLIHGLGQPAELSHLTADYLRWLAPGLISYAIHWTAVTWIQAMHGSLTHLPPIVAASGIVCHIPLTFVLVQYQGYKGCAMATSVFQFVQPLQLLLYLFATRHGNTRLLTAMGIPHGTLSFWKEAYVAVSSWPGILQYLQLALSGMIAISEWWASEIMIVLAGRLSSSSSTNVGAMSLFQSLNTLCFVLPVSCSIAGAMRVGTALGGANVAGAIRASRVSVGLAVSASTALAIVLYAVLPHSFFPSLFVDRSSGEDDEITTNNDDLIAQTSLLIPFLCVYIIGDAFATSLNGILRGSGRQAATVPVVLIAYWAFGVPLSYWLAFSRQDDGDDCTALCGVQALVFGSTAGTWCHAILLAIIVLARTDWHEQVCLAQARLEEK